MSKGIASVGVGIDAEKLQGVDISTVAPTDNQVMIYDNSGNKWQAETLAVPTGVTVTEWAPYTPVFSAGFGAVSGNTFFWRRVGDTLEVKGFIQAGTTSAVTASVSLPAGLSLNSSKYMNNKEIAGIWFLSQATSVNIGSGVNGSGVMTASSVSTSSMFFCATTKAGTLEIFDNDNVNSFLGSNSRVSVRFRAAINGWTTSN